MPSLDPKVTVHNFPIMKGISHKKQTQRHFLPQLIPDIKQEVKKIIDVGFIREVKYPT